MDPPTRHQQPPLPPMKLSLFTAEKLRPWKLRLHRHRVEYLLYRRALLPLQHASLIRLVHLRGGGDAARAVTPGPSQGDRGTFPGLYPHPTPSTRSTRLCPPRTGSNVVQTTAAAKGCPGLLSARLFAARTTPVITTSSMMALYRRQGLGPNSGWCLLHTTAMVPTSERLGRGKSDRFGESQPRLYRCRSVSPASKP